MVRRQFDEQLAELKDLLTRMGELNCEAIGDAVTALETQDSELARRIRRMALLRGGIEIGDEPVKETNDGKTVEAV